MLWGIKDLQFDIRNKSPESNRAIEEVCACVALRNVANVEEPRLFARTFLHKSSFEELTEKIIDTKCSAVFSESVAAFGTPQKLG
jgi:hypothetical protein